MKGIKKFKLETKYEHKRSDGLTRRGQKRLDRKLGKQPTAETRKGPEGLITLS